MFLKFLEETTTRPQQSFPMLRDKDGGALCTPHLAGIAGHRAKGSSNSYNNFLPCTGVDTSLVQAGQQRPHLHATATVNHLLWQPGSEPAAPGRPMAQCATHRGGFFLTRRGGDSCIYQQMGLRRLSMHYTCMPCMIHHLASLNIKSCTRAALLIHSRPEIAAWLLAPYGRGVSRYMLRIH